MQTSIESNFQGLNSRLSEVEKRMDGMEEKLQGIPAQTGSQWPNDTLEFCTRKHKNHLSYRYNAFSFLKLYLRQNLVTCSIKFEWYMLHLMMINSWDPMKGLLCLVWMYLTLLKLKFLYFQNYMSSTLGSTCLTNDLIWHCMLILGLHTAHSSLVSGARNRDLHIHE